MCADSSLLKTSSVDLTLNAVPPSILTHFIHFRTAPLFLCLPVSCSFLKHVGHTMWDLQSGKKNNSVRHGRTDSQPFGLAFGDSHASIMSRLKVVDFRAASTALSSLLTTEH